MEPLLMSSENPQGYKLEQILAQLITEITWKINKVIHDTSPYAAVIVKNNLAIIEHLGAAVALQETSMAILNAKAPNEGPLGTPRIGTKESIGMEVFVKSLQDPVVSEEVKKIIEKTLTEALKCKAEAIG